MFKLPYFSAGQPRFSKTTLSRSLTSLAIVLISCMRDTPNRAMQKYFQSILLAFFKKMKIGFKHHLKPAQKYTKHIKIQIKKATDSNDSNGRESVKRLNNV